MSRLHSLKVLINQRLTAAVDELFGHLERTLSEYEEEVECRYRTLLDAASKREDEPQAAAVQQQLVIKEEVPEQVEWNPSLDQEESVGPHIKEEVQDFWSSQELRSQLQELHKEDTTRFPFSDIHVKREDAEEKAQSSQPHQRHTEENREIQTPSSSSIEQLKEEADGGPHAHRISVSCLSGSDKTLRHCQAETENYGDVWKEISKSQTDFNTMKNRVPENGMGCNTANKLFSCSKCGRKFGQKHHLLIHMRCHTGEKPFSCSLCGRRFSQKGNLTQHLTVHTREKAFSCPVCGERFAQKGNLTQHLTVHTRENPCSCPVCGERFAQQGSLTQHLTVHTQVNTCSCPVCGERFAQKGNLTQHMTVHKREKLSWKETDKGIQR